MGSYQTRDRTHVSYILAGKLFTTDPPGKPPKHIFLSKKKNLWSKTWKLQSFTYILFKWRTTIFLDYSFNLKVHAIIKDILVDIHNDKCIFTKSPKFFIKNFSCNFPSERPPCSVCVNLFILAKKEWRKAKKRERKKERERKEGERAKERQITVNSYRSSQGTAPWLSMHVMQLGLESSFWRDQW